MNRSFITVDVDWASDEVIADTLQLFEDFDYPSTWLVTHQTSLLADMHSDPRIEVGIHPSFNHFLNGDSNQPRRGANQVIAEIMELVPDAKVVRSHSMLSSSRLLDAFREVGLSHDLNVFIPGSTDMELRPWPIWNGLVRVPTCWEDDVALLFAAAGRTQPDPEKLAIEAKGTLVFNFHPIHVFLNTESLDRYEASRPIQSRPTLLKELRCKGFGTRDRLINVLRYLSRPN